MALVFGKGGQGKTTLAQYLCRLWERDQGSNIVVVDPIGAWTRDPDHCFYNAFDHFPGQFPCIVNPTSDENATALFTELLTWRDFLLVVDELQIVGDSYQIIDPLKRLALYGRNYGVTFCGITRYPHLINPAFRHNWTSIYCFRLLEPPEIKYLTSLTGQDCEFLHDLGDYQFATFEN
jgi:Cdc6-like AAA superfamily ATPase